MVVKKGQQVLEGRWEVSILEEEQSKVVECAAIGWSDLESVFKCMPPWLRPVLPVQCVSWLLETWLCRCQVVALQDAESCEEKEV